MNAIEGSLVVKVNRLHREAGFAPQR